MGDAIIPSDWTGEYCLFAVCWPNSPQWLAVLRGALSIPQEGRFWDADSGTITVAQDIVEETFDYNFRNEGVLMTCNDGVTQALNAIAVALANGGSGNCGGQSCYNSQTVGVQNILTLDGGYTVPVYGSAPAAVLPESGYPAGYTDEAEYMADKCAKANKIVSDFIASLNQLSGFAWYQSVAGVAFLAACFVGLIALPVAAVPVVLFILLTTEAIDAAIIAFANWCEDNRSDLVCALYDNGSPDAIIAAISSLLTIAISAISVEGAAALALRQIVLTMFGYDVLNLLFTDQAKASFPDADCSDCVGGVDVIQIYDTDGVWVDASVEWGEEVTINFVPYTPNGFYYSKIRIANNTSENPDDYVFTISAATLGNSGSCPDQYTGAGAYGPENWGEQGFLSWEFGCTNSFATSVTGTFTKSV